MRIKVKDWFPIFNKVIKCERISHRIVWIYYWYWSVLTKEAFSRKCQSQLWDVTLRIDFSISSLIFWLLLPVVYLSFRNFYFRVFSGLRFTRVLRLMTIPDVLQYLNVLKTSNSIRLCQLVSLLVSVWFTAAGFIHLVSIYMADVWAKKTDNGITHCAPQLSISVARPSISKDNVNDVYFVDLAYDTEILC